jgi:hypothetical protein
VNGLCVYFNVRSDPIEIGGEETATGEFYPDVIYEISNGDGDWETITAPKIGRGTRTTTVVGSRATSRPFKVNLDIFVPYIGKAKYGRIVLETIESAVFRIDELQPGKK